MNKICGITLIGMAITGALLTGGTLKAETAQEDLMKKIVINPEPLGKLRPVFEKLQKEKIRMGYGGESILRSTDEPKLPDVLPVEGIDAGKYRFDILRQMSESGFNVVSLLYGGWPKGPAEEINGQFPRIDHYLRFGAEGCKRYNLSMLVNLQYGQFSKNYRRYSDGTATRAKVALCPRNWDYWQNEMLRRALVVAKVSKEYPRILGVNFDFEMYISDFTHYPGPCMCDVCFNDFAKECIPNIDVTKIDPQERLAWLSVNELNAVYARFMEREVGDITTRVEQELHKVNPDFVIANWPAFEWLPGITRGLGTPEQPLIIFSELEYVPGYSPVIAERKMKCEKEGYPALYCPGLWLMKHDPKNIPGQLYSMALASDGCWFFTLASLAAGNLGGDYKLYKGSTVQEYWDAFRAANTSIVDYLNKGKSCKPPFTLPEVQNVVKPTGEAFRAIKPPVLDGKLDDPCWEKSVPLRLKNNKSAQLFSPSTTGRICYDDQYLYITVQCDEPQMDKLKADITGAGDFKVFRDDVVELFLDPDYTMNAYFHIGINANGAVAEHRFFGIGGEDRSWKSGVQVTSTKRKDGWDLEMAIPLTNLTKVPVKTWGANITRNRSIGDSDRQAAWSPTFGFFAEPSRFGKIELVK